MLAALMGTGLSAAAGLNAYIPFLIVACLARFTDVINLPAQFAWMESWWALAGGSILLLSEIVLDKIAVVDHINDAIGTFIRPSVGGLIFAATQAADRWDHSEWMTNNQWLGVLIGIITAGVVHATKATARPAINATTLGIGTPLVSAAEDTGSVGLSLLAIFTPLLVIVALLVLFWLIFAVWARARRLKRRYDSIGSGRGGGGATALGS